MTGVSKSVGVQSWTWAALIAAYVLVAMVWVHDLAGLVILRTPTVEAGQANLEGMRSFWIGSAALWAVLTAMAIILRRQQWTHDCPPPSPPVRHDFARAAVVLLIAASLRGYVVATHEPSISDDIWRYVLDGNALSHGHNPYLVAPIDVDPENPRFAEESEIASRVNNPELVTIYLPTSQLVFAGAARIARGHDVDTQARIFRTVFVLIELIGIGVVLLLLRLLLRSVWWATLYAWHPLAISEVAGSGHQDPIGITLLVISLLAYVIARKRTAVWTAILALAGLVKPIPIPLAAIMLRGESKARWVFSLVVGAIVSALLAGPLMLTHDMEPFRAFWSTADRFIHHWAFHGSVYAPLLEIGFEPDTARRICALLLLLVLGLCFTMGKSVWSSARTFMLAALLFSTTAHPWYLLWALMFMPLAPSPAIWIASLTLPWGYAVLGDVVGWTVPSMLIWLTYPPIYAALFIDWMRRFRHVGARP